MKENLLLIYFKSDDSILEKKKEKKAMTLYVAKRYAPQNLDFRKQILSPPFIFTHQTFHFINT